MTIIRFLHPLHKIIVANRVVSCGVRVSVPPDAVTACLEVHRPRKETRRLRPLASPRKCLHISATLNAYNLFCPLQKFSIVLVPSLPVPRQSEDQSQSFKIQYAYEIIVPWFFFVMEIACVMYKVQAGTKGTAVSLNLTLEHVRSISPRLQCIDVYDVLVMNSCACGEILQCVWFVNTATAHLKESHVQVFFWGGGRGG